MRPIKFRGKRIDNGEWNYGTTSDEWDGQKILKMSTFWLLVYSNFFDPETVGQFTGLTDKNGKEIYGEGDIYKDAKGIISVVEMAVDGWALFPIKKETPVRNLYWHNICEKTQGEIIGDIHTTPELLGKET